MMSSIMSIVSIDDNNPVFDGVGPIGREPGPGLRMFSAKFFSLSFLVNLCHGPSQVYNDHSQLGAYLPQGAKQTFGSKNWVYSNVAPP